MQGRWLGRAGLDWAPRCGVYLYAGGEAYSRATGERATNAGHAKYVREGGTILSRRIHLRVDDVNLLTRVLPHETTHLVLADRFTGRDLPRWADEGMATLAEPREAVERHLRV